MTVVIRCTQLTKTYGRGATATTALRGVDLEVREEELLMLVGPSGSGKTTLLSIIAGVLDSDGGTCEVFGRDLQHLSNSARSGYRGREVGFVFQSFNLIPTLSVAENVAIPLLIGGWRRHAALARAREVLGQVGLTDRFSVPPNELSGGQQQRVALARAIVHEPKLIICDEPTSSLDHETGMRVMEVLRSVGRRQGRALLVVTHDTRIFSFADRIAEMDDGRVVAVKEGNSTC